MSEVNDGGPAFPMPNGFQPAVGASRTNGSQSGMSLRDWFAGKALEAMIPLAGEMVTEFAPAGIPLKLYVAQSAYEYADHMLEARKS